MNTAAPSTHGPVGCLPLFLGMPESTLKYQAYLYIGGTLYSTGYLLGMSPAMAVGSLPRWTPKSSPAHVINIFFRRQSQQMEITGGWREGNQS